MAIQNLIQVFGLNWIYNCKIVTCRTKRRLFEMNNRNRIHNWSHFGSQCFKCRPIYLFLFFGASLSLPVPLVVHMFYKCHRSDSFPPIGAYCNCLYCPSCQACAAHILINHTYLSMKHFNEIQEQKHIQNILK